MTVHWLWLFAALFGGAFLGFLTAALCYMSGDRDGRAD
jgi:uncharacterized protein involved in exopolysaccharide biosynthesis